VEKAFSSPHVLTRRLAADADRSSAPTRWPRLLIAIGVDNPAISGQVVLADAAQSRLQP
jgi:hypothetical protein